MMLDLMGQQLGNYRLIRKLREGAFAQIYLGEHVFLNKQAAIKVLRSYVTEDIQANFLKEAQLIASLEHPHIVRLLDFGVERQLSFLVMSYAPNGTLRQRHREGSRLPLITIVIYLKQIAAALQYAHEHHVIHRDVKPQNMLIGINDEILLSDFGLAIIRESTSSQNLLQQAGVVTYMAPEQFQGKAHYASDQYALGVAVYEWLGGECPFQGTYKEIAMQHQFAPPPSLHEKVSTISTALEQVVLKALAKDPKERFACVQDFATAFDQACHPLPPAETFSPGHNPQPSITPPLSLGASLMSRSRATLSRQKRVPTQTRILLGLMVLIAIGSLGLFAAAFITHHANVSVTATPNPSAIATAAAHTYATATSNGVMSGFDAQHTNFNPYERVLTATNVPHLVLDWTVSIGRYIASSPAIANGVVYIGSDDHQLHAIDAITGKPRWAAPFGFEIYSSPAVAQGIVYIGSSDSKLYAFDASTGKPRWAAPAGYQTNSSPVVAQGKVYIGSTDGKLYAFDASTGKPRWTAPFGGDRILAVADNVVYISEEGGDLNAFDASTGQLRWSTANVPVSFIGNSAPSLANNVVAIANNVVYAASQDGKLYAFDALTGKFRWATANALVASLAVANNVVYAASQDGKLYAFDGSTGKLHWSTTVGGNTTSPIIANGVVYVGFNFNLYAFDASTGKQLWATPTGNRTSSSPAVADGTVYVSGDDKLYAFHLPSAITR